MKFFYNSIVKMVFAVIVLLYCKITSAFGHETCKDYDILRRGETCYLFRSLYESSNIINNTFWFRTNQTAENSRICLFIKDIIRFSFLKLMHIEDIVMLSNVGCPINGKLLSLKGNWFAVDKWNKIALSKPQDMAINIRVNDNIELEISTSDYINFSSKEGYYNIFWNFGEIWEFSRNAPNNTVSLKLVTAIESEKMESNKSYGSNLIYLVVSSMILVISGLCLTIGIWQNCKALKLRKENGIKKNDEVPQILRPHINRCVTAAPPSPEVEEFGYQKTQVYYERNENEDDNIYDEEVLSFEPGAENINVATHSVYSNNRRDAGWVKENFQEQKMYDENHEEKSIYANI